jgi:hypothetical protein
MNPFSFDSAGDAFTVCQVLLTLTNTIWPGGAGDFALSFCSTCPTPTSSA